jgi:hypothetical protein
VRTRIIIGVAVDVLVDGPIAVDAGQQSILGDPATVGVKAGESQQGIRISLLSGLAVPGDGLAIILGNTTPAASRYADEARSQPRQ